jgi:hypothetical protein
MAAQHKPAAEHLAADLAADLLADMERDEPSAVTVPPRRVTTAETPPVYTVSSKLQVTPSSWLRPRVNFSPDGITTRIGPVHFELFLH